MKIAGEIGDEILIVEAIAAGDSSVVQEAPLMKRHFGNRRFQFDPRIPGSAFRSVKTAAVRAGMQECSVDDVSLRDAVQ